MNYISFCKNYFAVTRIPVSLLLGRKSPYSSLGELLQHEYMNNGELFWEAPYTQANPTFCRYSADIEYGCVHVEGTDYRVILGPSFSVPVTDEVVRTFMHENAISLDLRETVAEFLNAIPLISHSQFATHLALLHQILNGKEMQLEDYFVQEKGCTQERTRQQLHHRIDSLESNQSHNSWRYEQALFAHIKNGDIRQLEDFLMLQTKFAGEGKLASTPLRHAKNLFILTAAKIAVLSAIPAGVDIEKTYQLVDLYVQECEQQLTIDAVKTLQFSMLKDFCMLAGEARIPEGISAEVYQCISYIRSHTNTPVSVGSVAEHIHRSPSYTMKRFKEELGINIGAFITRCRLEEAKSLLAYSEKSLAEISSYLCFSSQSYFQNIFKKNYGITPMQYRRENARL
ncbi:MAG: AraC family transcriptional regulator [Butyrivibrio sp.]|nr:AraC family transcriptional regulator [Acetatifactor muris]MCM1558442.1 AraC family transcriptional regulator [Butyrivibrio sp.]